ncbi:MAG TPA: HPr family phosphocarrier protein [Parvularculaceae bacterium]|nr:HPr family phosphocarrier protein [Parvularculaceae bacterium]
MNEPISAVATISNIRGLHARAAAKFGAIASSFKADVHVEYDGWRVRGDSIMGLLMIGAGPGAEIAISAAGPQAAEAVDALAKFVADKFGEKE